MRASQISVTVPASASTVIVGSTCVSGSECASGISSSVRLAAWIAASRATVSDVALRRVARPATRAAASGDIRTTARARAQRDGLRLGADVDHAGVARGVEVGERALHGPHGIQVATAAAVRSVAREDLRPPVRRPARARRVPTTSSSTCPTTPRAGDVLAAMGLQPGQCIVALDREYARADEPRALPTHEVALIPPVSGGAEAPVRLVEVTDAAARPRGGRRRRARPARGRRRAASRASRARSRRSTTRPTSRWRARSSRRSAPRRPSGTGCARSRSSTASGACR